MGGDSGDSIESSAAVSPDGATTVTINIRCSNGSKFTVRAERGSSVSAFKVLVASNCEVPAAQQRLIYKGRILKDDQTLESYGVESEHTIHLVRGAAPSPTPSAPVGANAGNLRTPTAAPSDGETGGLNNNEGGNLGNIGFGGTLFPGLGTLGSGGAPGSGGASNLFGSGFPDFDQMQRQISQNPSMMRDMMNMPFVQNLMNNPELMRNLIMSNPQMREIIDRNPELAHILNDSSILRQTLEATRNPELMREMMRNTDRAMSNIESSPEGFNMLRRMYENVQEPLLNATTMAGETGSNLGLAGNQGTGATQARDTSTNPSVGSEAAPASPAPNTNPLPNPWSNNAAGGQATNGRPAPGGDVRPPNLAGLGGGLGLPDLQRSTQDPSLFSQVLQNPAMSQMMQSLLSNPQYVNQILSLNPEMRNLMEGNPQLREMLQNPEFLQHLSSPDTLRQLFTLQQSLASLGLRPPGQDQNQTGAAGIGSFNNLGLDQLMNMFADLGGGGSLGVPNTANIPPEELYASQLSQLQDMGFIDTQANIRALRATGGNVHAAVDRLLNPGQ